MENEIITFTIPGTPVPKARARVTRGGWSFTPKKTRQYENLVKMMGILARKGCQLSISGGDFCLEVICYGAKRGDADNYLKSIMDGLEGVFWENDKSVVDARVVKTCCAKGEERVVVRISKSNLQTSNEEAE